MGVRSRLQGVFRNVFDDDNIEIFDAMTTDDITDWDSLIHINLVVAAEKEFGISFSLKEVVFFKNVGEFIAMIQLKTGANE